MAIYKYYKFSFIKPSRIDATDRSSARPGSDAFPFAAYLIFFNCTLQQACDLINLKPVSPLLDANREREREGERA